MRLCHRVRRRNGAGVSETFAAGWKAGSSVSAASFRPGSWSASGRGSPPGSGSRDRANGPAPVLRRWAGIARLDRAAGRAGRALGWFGCAVPCFALIGCGPRWWASPRLERPGDRTFSGPSSESKPWPAKGDLRLPGTDGNALSSHGSGFRLRKRMPPRYWHRGDRSTSCPAPSRPDDGSAADRNFARDAWFRGLAGRALRSGR